MGRTADNENGQERSTEMPRDVQKHQVRTPLQRRQRAAWGTLHRFQNSEEKSLERGTQEGSMTEQLGKEEMDEAQKSPGTTFARKLSLTRCQTSPLGASLHITVYVTGLCLTASLVSKF